MKWYSATGAGCSQCQRVGYEEDTEAVPPEEVPPLPRLLRMPRAGGNAADASHWVHGAAAAVAAARRAFEEEQGSAAQAAEAAAAAAAAAAEAAEDDAVATKAFVPAAPDSRRRRVPSAVVRAARADAAATAEAAATVTAASPTPASPTPAAAADATDGAASSGSGVRRGVASADDGSGSTSDEAPEVEMAAGAFTVRVEWRHSGSHVAAASGGDVLVARCATAEVAQVCLPCTSLPLLLCGWWLLPAGRLCAPSSPTHHLPFEPIPPQSPSPPVIQACRLCTAR